VVTQNSLLEGTEESTEEPPYQKHSRTAGSDLEESTEEPPYQKHSRTAGSDLRYL